MSSISSNLQAKFIFLNLHPETNGGKVELLGTEQSWALNDLVPVLLSHPITVPSLAASYSFSWASSSKRLLEENLILVQLPQGAPRINQSQATGQRVFHHWAMLQTWLVSGGHCNYMGLKLYLLM